MMRWDNIDKKIFFLSYSILIKVHYQNQCSFNNMNSWRYVQPSKIFIQNWKVWQEAGWFTKQQVHRNWMNEWFILDLLFQSHLNLSCRVSDFITYKCQFQSYSQHNRNGRSKSLLNSSHYLQLHALHNSIAAITAQDSKKQCFNFFPHFSRSVALSLSYTCISQLSALLSLLELFEWMNELFRTCKTGHGPNHLHQYHEWWVLSHFINLTIK